MMLCGLMVERHMNFSDETEAARYRMVQRQIAARGITAPEVLAAMESVPREKFMPPHLAFTAYEDSPQPIGEGQTISQPYIVAYMIEAMELRGGERVLEIGTGSGYAAAVAAKIAGEVVTIERLEGLAKSATAKLAELGFDNVRVICGDGTKGFPERAPYDAIMVAAGGPDVPPSLQNQLAIGGRLVIPVGTSQFLQSLVRIRRVSETEFKREHLTEVRFVPLIGEEAWQETRAGLVEAPPVPSPKSVAPTGLPELIWHESEGFDDIDTVDLDPLMDRIGDARVVLMGEATHGTSEFYRMRARMTQELIVKKGFNVVAVEADWPDAARIDHYVRHRQYPPSEWTAFARFPQWMWRNREVREFVDWLRVHNAEPMPAEQRVGFYGLDLYSLFASIDAVLTYLDEVDPEAAAIARGRYDCLAGWRADPASYGRAALSGRYEGCASGAVAMLTEILDKRISYMARDGERFMDAAQNARLVVDAERYYRAMYLGAHESWNLRDSHMFDTLKAILSSHGPKARAVVWAHNSHVGNAAATDMTRRGEHNIGQLARQEWGHNAYLIGFGTHEGTVAAASGWDHPMEIMKVRPSHRESYEYQFHQSGQKALLLPLRPGPSPQIRKQLMKPALERAIGVIYRPATEMISHYFEATLPEQFDEYIWFDRTQAVTPLATEEIQDMPDTYPFGL